MAGVTRLTRLGMAGVTRLTRLGMAGVTRLTRLGMAGVTRLTRLGHVRAHEQKTLAGLSQERGSQSSTMPRLLVELLR